MTRQCWFLSPSVSCGLTMNVTSPARHPSTIAFVTASMASDHSGSKLAENNRQIYGCTTELLANSHRVIKLCQDQTVTPSPKHPALPSKTHDTRTSLASSKPS